MDYRTVLFGGIAMVVLAITLAQFIGHESEHASTLVVAVTVVAAGLAIGNLAAALLAKHERQEEDRAERSQER